MNTIENILKISGHKDMKSFYKDFPDEAAFMAKYGKEFKKVMAMGGLIGQAQQGMSTAGQGLQNYINNKRPGKANLGAAFFGNFLEGGMGVKGAVKGVMGLINRKNEFEAEQDLQQQQQREFLTNRAMSNLPGQQQYVPTFAMGGKINPSELAKGTKEEMEYTKSKKKSKKIALEHLREVPDYYTKLKKAGLADSYQDGGNLPNYKDIYKGIREYQDFGTTADTTRLTNDFRNSGGVMSRFIEEPINPRDTMSNETLEGYNNWMKSQIDSIQNTSQIPQYNEAPIYEGLLNSYAVGGNIGGYNNIDNTTVYANGGQHEINPIGGVPVGNNALVEEGEVRFGDYIFSNRIPYKKK